MLLLQGILRSLVGIPLLLSICRGHRQGGVARDVEKVAVVVEMSVGVMLRWD